MVTTHTAKADLNSDLSASKNLQKEMKKKSFQRLVEEVNYIKIYTF